MRQHAFFRNILSLSLVLAGSFAAGCANRQQAMQGRLDKLSPEPNALQIVRENARATGSWEAWSQARQIDAFLLATEHSAERGKYLIEQQQKLLLGPRIEVTMTSRDPEGTTLEHLRKNGTVEMLLTGGPKPVPITDPESLRGAGIKLRLLAVALSGPVGLLQDGYQIRYAGEERKGGRLTYKLVFTPALAAEHNGLAQPLDWFSRPVLKNPEWLGDRLLVWFDAQTMRIDRLWVRYRLDDGQFGYLALNVQRYQECPGGYFLPTYLEFIRSDEYQQFSETPILTMEYQQLTVVQEK